MLDAGHHVHVEGETREDTQRQYIMWAASYDTDPRRNRTNMIAEEAATLYRTGERHAKRVLDCAAGTGLVGQELYDLGFTHIDALDASASMLQEARKKNIYGNLIEAYLGPSRLPIEVGTYDLLVGAGLFAPGHVNPDALPEMIRVMKPGGLILLVIREEWLKKSAAHVGMEDVMKGLELAGKWKQLKRIVIPDYYPYPCETNQGQPGILWLYMVL